MGQVKSSQNLGQIVIDLTFVSCPPPRHKGSAPGGDGVQTRSRRGGGVIAKIFAPGGVGSSCHASSLGAATKGKCIVPSVEKVIELMESKEKKKKKPEWQYYVLLG
jgi:hypothetical protein